MFRNTTWAALLVAAVLGIAGCDMNDGPAEEVGENIDEAADELEDAVDDAGN